MFLSEWREFPWAPCLAGKEKKLDRCSCLEVVEIARVPDMLPSLFPSWSDTRYIYTLRSTRYRNWHFFNNFTTNEDIATKFESDYRQIPLHFSHNERTAVQISLQYLHWR